MVNEGYGVICFPVNSNQGVFFIGVLIHYDIRAFTKLNRDNGRHFSDSFQTT